MTCTIRKSLLCDRPDLERIIESNKDKIQDIFINDFTDETIDEIITNAVSFNKYNQLFTLEFESKIIAFILFSGFNIQKKYVFFSYILDKQYHRKGLIIEVCKDILIQYLNYEPINKIYIIIDQKNIPSIKFARKLLFKRAKYLKSILSPLFKKRILNLYYISKQEILTLKT